MKLPSWMPFASVVERIVLDAMAAVGGGGRAIDVCRWIDLCHKWERLVALGEARTASKAHLKTCSTKGRRDTNVLGIMGEEVLACVLGLKVDEMQRPEGDEGFDFVIGGVTVDVKATDYDDGHLIDDTNEQKAARQEVKPRADIFVLVYVDWENKCGRVVGWCTREELEAAYNPNFRKLGPRLAIPGDELEPGLPPEVVAWVASARGCTTA